MCCVIICYSLALQQIPPFLGKGPNFLCLMYIMYTHIYMYISFSYTSSLIKRKLIRSSITNFHVDMAQHTIISNHAMKTQRKKIYYSVLFKLLNWTMTKLQLLQCTLFRVVQITFADLRLDLQHLQMCNTSVLFRWYIVENSKAY